MIHMNNPESKYSHWNKVLFSSFVEVMTNIFVFSRDTAQDHILFCKNVNPFNYQIVSILKSRDWKHFKSTLWAVKLLCQQKPQFHAVETVVIALHFSCVLYFIFHQIKVSFHFLLRGKKCPVYSKNKYSHTFIL